MIKITKKEKCSGCHACSNVCPVNCIFMIEDNEGFLYPKVDKTKCIKCGLCEKICPMINNKEKVNDTISYACINKNESIRSESSSGGIFTLLAENVINNGGVVFGAGFDTNFNLVHSYTDTMEGLSKFRGSKYLQSKIGNTYRQAKNFLEEGFRVLFSGTPCQIAGLIAFLGKDYNNLICIDIICHGVPSPKVFKMYRTEFEKKYGATTRRITFRHKNTGWKSYSISLVFNNNTEYRKNFKQDVFMKGFLCDLYLRPSCYDCKCKTLNRLSDITIADFWGIENIVPDMDDDKGTSLVLINSNKGKKVFQNLQDKIIVKQVECDEAIRYNSSAIKSVNMNTKRGKFFKELDSESCKISKLINQYTKISLLKRVCRKTKVIINKIKITVLS